jgi:hypothetical protein
MKLQVSIRYLDCVTTDTVWIGLIDTTRPKVIAALSLFSTCHRSLHAVPSPTCSVSNSHSLTTASNSHPAHIMFLRLERRLCETGTSSSSKHLCRRPSKRHTPDFEEAAIRCFEEHTDTSTRSAAHTLTVSHMPV